MTLSPIAARELRVRSRKPITQARRVLVVCVATLIALGAGAMALGARTQGSGLFLTLSGLSFLFCLFEGLRQTVDSLSEEKREGTLGLLFLTDLQGHDVVLGKLAARSIDTFYGVLGVAPILGISLVMGGVTGGQFARMMLAILNSLLFALAVGLWASSRSRDYLGAWRRALLVLLLIGLLLPLGGEILQRISHPIPWPALQVPLQLLGQLAIGASPLGAFVPELAGRSSGTDFWVFLGAGQGISCLLLWRAACYLPSSWQDDPQNQAGLLPAVQLPARALAQAEVAADSTPAAERRFQQFEPRRRRLLAISPVAWLALRGTHGPGPVWGLALLGVIWAGWASFDQGFASVAWFFMFVTKLWLRVWVAIQAGRVFIEARKTGALELLLSTPLSPRQLMNGQWRALCHLFLGPVLLMTSADLVFTLYGGRSGLPVGGAEVFRWLKVLAGLTLPLHLSALAFVSMWLALRLRRPTGTVGLSLVLVYVLPQFLCISLLTLLSDVCFFFWARARVEAELHNVASRGLFAVSNQ